MARNFASRLFGRSTPASDAGNPDGFDAMTAAFLDADTRLGQIDASVEASAQTRPRLNLRTSWSTIREHYAHMTSDYLALADAAAGGRWASPSEYQRCLAEIQRVRAEMDEFAHRNAAELNRAHADEMAIGQSVQRARVAAHDARTRLAGIDSAYRGYPSITRAAEGLEAASAGLAAAADLGAERTAAEAVQERSTALVEAIDAAPGRRAAAETVIRSVQTRESAIRTRREQMAPARSALLREFNAASSADLIGNDAVAARTLAAAADTLSAARQNIATAPELALSDAEVARDHLDTAESAVDAVTDRLRLLRDVRADPAAVAGRVRFRLRDAQHLAVQSGLVDEWGSVLDAQADRIDRASDALGQVHPDYWAYLTQLTTVERRIVEIVNRMRGRSAP